MFSPNGHAHMENPRKNEESAHTESLAAALRAVLARYGQNQAYENVLAALGLGVLVTAHPDESLRHWPTLGRDLCLSEGAARFGLRMRPLHPPDAADGLGQSREYAGHFHDSYLPLIQTALAHEQLVLAWRGWPAPQSRHWGVIAGERDGMLWGLLPGLKMGEVPLIDPAHQVYVVEEYQSPKGIVNEIDLFEMVCKFARELWRGSRSSYSGLLTGEQAYHAWVQRLREPENEESVEPNVWELHRVAVQAMLAARRTMVVFLKGCVRRRSTAAERWAESVERTIELLRPYDIDAVGAGGTPTTEWMERAVAALEAAHEEDSRAMAELAMMDDRA